MDWMKLILAEIQRINLIVEIVHLLLFVLIIRGYSYYKEKQIVKKIDNVFDAYWSLHFNMTNLFVKSYIWYDDEEDYYYKADVDIDNVDITEWEESYDIDLNDISEKIIVTAYFEDDLKKMRAGLVLRKEYENSEEVIKLINMISEDQDNPANNEFQDNNLTKKNNLLWNSLLLSIPLYLMSRLGVEKVILDEISNFIIWILDTIRNNASG